MLPRPAFLLAAILSTTAWSSEPSDPGHRLYVMNADGSQLKHLTIETEYDGHGSPVWSPDGKAICFDAWRASKGEKYQQARVIVIDRDGRKVRSLGDGAMPSFSKDLSQIAYSRYRPNRGVWLMNADGSNKTRLDAGGWAARWSPNGHYVAYTTYERGPNFKVYDVRDKSSRTLLTAEQSARYSQIYWSFCWSPDSKRLCFKAKHRDVDQYDVATVSLAEAENRVVVLLTRKTGNKFSWHPAGKQIIFSMRDPMRKLQQLYVLDVDKNSPPNVLRGQPVDRDNTGADWSPDGKSIVFSSRKIAK